MKEIEKVIRDLIVSVFLKECANCSEKFKDTLDGRVICLNCERDEKLNKILKKKK